MNTRDFIENQRYISYVKDLNQSLNEKIDLSLLNSVRKNLENIYNTNKYDKYLELELIDSLCAIQDKSISFANINYDNLLELIENFKEETIKFIFNSNLEFSKLTKKEIEQNTIIEQPNIIFPIGHLINFYLIKYDLNIDDYVKKLKIPNPRKYVSILKSIYDQSFR